MQDVNQKFCAAGAGIFAAVPGNVQNGRRDAASITYKSRYNCT